MSRGRERELVGASSSLVRGGRVAPGEYDVVDVSVPDVVDVTSPGLMSDVTGGLVLVIVDDVVVAASLRDDEPDSFGSR